MEESALFANSFRCFSFFCRLWQQSIRARRCERWRWGKLEPVQPNGATWKHDEHSIDHVKDEQDVGQLHQWTRPMSKHAPSKVLFIQWSKQLQADLTGFWKKLETWVSFKGKRFCHRIRRHQEAPDAAERWKLDWGVAVDRVSKCSRTPNSTVSWNFESGLLSRISYWDLHREKVVVLTDNSVINVTYDFIGKKITDYTRIMLADLKKIRFGNLTYPKGSMMG